MKYFVNHIKKGALFLLLVFSFSFIAKAGDDRIRIDSLEYELTQTNDRETEFDLLIELARAYRHIDAIKTLTFADRALKLVEGSSDHIKKGLAYTYIARAYFISGNFKQALSTHFNALESFIVSKDSLDIANTYLNIGEDYRLLSDPGQAIDHYLKALSIYERLNQTTNIASIYTNIGIIYNSRGEQDKAIEQYEKALQFAEASGDSLFISKLLNNLGNAYAAFEMYEKTIELHQRSLKIRRSLNKPYYIAGSLLNIGSIYSRMGENEAALRYTKEAAEIAAEINDNYTVGLANHNIGLILHSLGQSQEAVEHISSAADHFEESGNISMLVESLSFFSKLYSDIGQFESALKVKEKELNFRDTLYQREKQQKLTEMQTKYEVIQKDNEIILLQQENRISMIQRNLFIVGMVAFLLIIVLLYLYLRTRIKQSKLLLSKQHELFKKEQLLKNAELKRKELEQRQMEQELELKTKQLTSHTLNIIQKNKLFEELQQKLKDLKNANGNFNDRLYQLNKYINYSFKVDDDWEDFKLYFEQVDQDFYKQLKKFAPELSPSELRLAALIRLNMSIKEAASVLNISPGSVKTARYRLRKKLNLEIDSDLNDFIISI